MKICTGKFCTIRVLSVITAALFVLLAAIVVLSFIGIPYIINRMIDQSVRLKPNSDQWERFLNLPLPLVTNIYLFTVKNPDGVANKGEIPILEEVGPYVYKQNVTKEVTDINISEDSVSYEKISKFSFDQELSGSLTEDDVVTVLNPALLVLAQITTVVEQLVVVGCLDKIFPKELYSMFITAPIRTLMIEGFTFANYSTDIGYACNIVRDQLIEKTLRMKNIKHIFSTEDPEMVQMLNFSYIGFKDTQPDGKWTVNRGIDDITQLGNTMKWNGETHTPYYGQLLSQNETCQRVRGSDSTIYPPRVNKDSKFEIFSTDICRTIQLSYTGEDTYKGIKGYKFEPSETTLYPQTTNPIQDCYCTQKTLNQSGQEDCYLNGVLDVYDCFGAPLLLSFPHFLYADHKYLEGVQNLTEPDKSLHGIYLLLEPNTGTPLGGRKRVQLNMVLRPNKLMPFAANLPKTVIPLLWIDETADLTDELIDMLNDQFFNPVKWANGLKYALIAVFGAGFLVVGGILFRKKFFNW